MRGKFLSVCSVALTRTITSRYERLLFVVLSVVIAGTAAAHTQDGMDPIVAVVKLLPVDAQGTTVPASTEPAEPTGTTGTS